MTRELQKKPKVKLNVNTDAEKNEKANLDPPEDKFYIIYVLFFLLGLVQILPWTFFNNANGVSTLIDMINKMIFFFSFGCTNLEIQPSTRLTPNLERICKPGLMLL